MSGQFGHGKEAHVKMGYGQFTKKTRASNKIIACPLTSYGTGISATRPRPTLPYYLVHPHLPVTHQRASLGKWPYGDLGAAYSTGVS